MALVTYRMPNGETIQVDYGPVEEYRDDLVRQAARGDAGSPEAIERSRLIRESLLRMSSQQLVLLVGELSSNFLSQSREIRRLKSLP